MYEHSRLLYSGHAMNWFYPTKNTFSDILVSRMGDVLTPNIFKVVPVRNYEHAEWFKVAWFSISLIATKLNNVNSLLVKYIIKLYYNTSYPLFWCV